MVSCVNAASGLCNKDREFSVNCTGFGKTKDIGKILKNCFSGK